MNRNLLLIGAALYSWSLPYVLRAQVQGASQLTIEVRNHRIYVFDVDRAQFAKSANSLSRAEPATFESWLGIGDIVSVNGTPVKGTVFERSTTILTSPTVSLGRAITDAGRGGIYEWNLEILNLDATPIGRVLVQGLSGGPPPPGAPGAVSRGSYAVIGGTGAFLGVRGGYFQSDIDPSSSDLTTSVAEDPAFRRTIGGGTLHLSLFLIPQSRPEIMATPAGPSITHANDFTLVNSSKPAAPGEALSLFATGLGPTRPSVDPGKPFPSDPPAVVAAPVAVTVNGKPAELLAAVGFPGAVDAYQVNFRLPSDTAQGMATIQVSAAWVAGTETRIPVQ